MLLFPSPPIQSAQTSYKVGLFIGRIEQSGQTISRGPVFLVLQIKEFLYSYLSIPDRMIGSLFYSTTGLHGAHATLGMPHFYLIPSMILSSFPMDRLLLSDSLSSSTRSINYLQPRHFSPFYLFFITRFNSNAIFFCHYSFLSRY